MKPAVISALDARSDRPSFPKAECTEPRLSKATPSSCVEASGKPIFGTTHSRRQSGADFLPSDPPWIELHFPGYLRRRSATFGKNAIRCSLFGVLSSAVATTRPLTSGINQ